jgi:hypothetical protein
MNNAVAVHSRKPQRRDIAECAKYTDYRDDLTLDFNNSCGYCDDSDEFVDRICFHIDHFAPQLKFPELKTKYTNLVYACRFCNMRKSDHWVGDDAAVHHNGKEGFVDPCSIDYELHLERNERGQIVAKSDLGKFIVRRLNLSLLRHELLWRSRRARVLRAQADAMIERFEADGRPATQEYLELLKRFRTLTKKIESYEFRAIKG